MSSVHDPRREQLIGLLQLPSHLQKTMKAILELGEATAEGIAEKTGRVRGYGKRLPQPAGEDWPRQEALAGKNRPLLTDGAARDGAEGYQTVEEERLLREGY